MGTALLLDETLSSEQSGCMVRSSNTYTTVERVLALALALREISVPWTCKGGL